MNDRQANYILTIAEEGSISRAAQRLHITQPSLSQLLIAVEKSYGVLLFERSNQQVIPTHAGNLLIKALHDMRKIENDLQLQINEVSSGKSGRITFGVTSSRGQYILPHVLPAFQRNYPNFEINLVDDRNSSLIEALVKGRMDIAVVNYTSCIPELEYIPLPSEEMVLVASNKHPLVWNAGNSKRRSISMSDIANELFIYLKSGHGVRTMTDSMFLASGIHPPKIYEVGSNALAHALAAQNLGITILPDNFIRFVLKETEGMAYLPFSDAAFFRKVAVCYPKSNILPKSIEFFSRCIVDTLQTLSLQHRLS